MSRITVPVLLLLILLNPSNCQRELASVYTFLRTDTILPGPSMSFKISLASGVFEFEFKTWVDQALVLYQDDQGISDHIQLTIQEGRLWFSFYGSKENTNPEDRIHGKFTSEKKYNDFSWHNVRIERNTSVTSIFINNGEERKSFQTNGLSSFTSNLTIGGFDREYISDLSSNGIYKIYAAPVNKRGFLNACVRNIKYGKTREDMRDISSQYVRKFKVISGCSLNHCHKPEPICKNNGKCSPDGKDDVTCDCRWTGFVKDYCQEGALELKLDGTYKVMYTSLITNEDQDRYKFRVKTLQKDALLFYAKGATNTEDFLIIEIKSSKLRLVINFGEQGVNYTAKSGDKISDGKWHTVEYTKQLYHFTLKVDKTAAQKFSIKSKSYKRIDYGESFFLGEISQEPYRNEIAIQDFIWENGKNRNEINFVTGLYETYFVRNEGFQVLPEYARPEFNKELPNPTPKPMPSTFPTGKPGCKEGECLTKSSVSTTQTTRKFEEPKNVARSEDDDEDSSVTWIVVVTVILSILLFAAIAFLVHKWNKRYSGDFQVNRKPVGPADTVVHYNKDAHKEKQRQMRL
ncbi:neurexin-3b-like [Dendronephthya gigantea]|uniref:neurexin-3b-like n=1 Tax=Dendronephthya gigantea TaxID=151771 RepID=UPI00106CF461|nr:neurexin-3b-like [Dendronephthya gigantea]